jgi:hypothetical protein
MAPPGAAPTVTIFAAAAAPPRRGSAPPLSGSAAAPAEDAAATAAAPQPGRADAGAARADSQYRCALPRARGGAAIRAASSRECPSFCPAQRADA